MTADIAHLRALLDELDRLRSFRDEVVRIASGDEYDAWTGWSALAELFTEYADGEAVTRDDDEERRRRARQYSLFQLGTAGLCPVCGGDLGGHVCRSTTDDEEEEGTDVHS